jgi:riboflavin synthase
MFSGIVNGAYELRRVDLKGSDYGQLTVALPAELLEGLKLGASVSIDGICLTATAIETEGVVFDVVKSTLLRTVASEYRIGDTVNVERSLKLNEENGGHEVSGHVDATCKVTSIEIVPGNQCVSFELEPRLARYIFPQGYVALNGVSLTVSDCLDGGMQFSVWLIPETLSRTNLGKLSVGDHVNIEIHRGVQVAVDTISESVERFLANALKDGRLTRGFVTDILKLMQGFSKTTLLEVRDSGGAIDCDDT